jgi:hypothetical protein
MFAFNPSGNSNGCDSKYNNWWGRALKMKAPQRFIPL